MDPRVAAALLESLAERFEAADEHGVLASGTELEALRRAVRLLAEEAIAEPSPQLKLPSSVPEGSVLGIDLGLAEPQVALRTPSCVEPLGGTGPLVRGQSLEGLIETVESHLPEKLRATPRFYVVPEVATDQERSSVQRRVREVGAQLQRKCEAVDRPLAVVAGRLGADGPRLCVCLVVHEGPRGRTVAPVVLRSDARGGPRRAYRVRTAAADADLDSLVPELARLAPPPLWVAASGWAQASAEGWVDAYPQLALAPPLRGLDALDARWSGAVGATFLDELEDRGWVKT